MYPSVILFVSSFFVLNSATSHAQLVPFPSNGTTRQNSICQQKLSEAPPFPILDIGLQHMLGQMGANATAAENNTIADANHQPHPPDYSRFTVPNQKDIAQCGPNQPCVDGSCCNSVRHGRRVFTRSKLTRDRKANVDTRTTTASRQL